MIDSVNIAAALGELRAATQRTRHLLALGEVLEEVGSLERLVSERKTELAAVDTQIDAKKKELGGLAAEHVDRVAKAEAEANAIRLDAEAVKAEAESHKAAAVRHLSSAKAEAESLVESAKSVAAGHVASGEDLLAKARSGADAIITEARARAQDVDVQTSAALERLEGIRSDIGAGSKTLTAIRSEIERLKSTFAN